MLNRSQKFRTRLLSVLPAFALALTLGCSSKAQEEDKQSRPRHRMSGKKMPDKNWEDKKFAFATGTSADGSIKLSVFFKETEGGLTAKLWARGLQPSAVHAVHVHENGVCNQPDYTSAGPHFDPAGTNLHGAPESPTSHLGDLGNITAGPDGQGRSKVHMHGATLTEGSTNVVGRAVILHAGADDFTTQPTGGSGGRLICAVIELGDWDKWKELQKDGFLKDWKGKDRKRKGEFERKKKRVDPKPPEIEQKPEQKPEGPGSTTDGNI